MKSPKQGAQTTIYCAVDNGLKNISGGYYSDCKEEKIFANKVNDEDSAKLWRISEEYVKNYL